MIENLLGGRFEGVELSHVRMAFARNMGELGRPSARKLALLPVLVARVVAARLQGSQVLYYPPAGPDRRAMYRDLAVLLATRWMFPKTVLHFHAGGLCELYPTLRPWLQALFRRAYGSPDVAIRTSALAPDDGAVVRARRQLVVENGVVDVAGPDVARERPERAQPTILFVGLLRESKGVLVLLDACALLRSRGLAFRAELIGAFPSPEMEARLSGRTRALGLQDVVELRGVLVGEDKHRVFAAADVFCFPSFFESETFGLVLVEAMQFGLPVVATRWRGIPGIVDDGVNGFLVPVKDSEALAERLGRLLADFDLRLAMGARGRQKYEERYTLARFHRGMQGVFDLLREDPSSAKPT
jgi:glycosyltransferase involved in cell wall biosynthesis